MLKMIQIKYGPTGVKYFTGFVGGTEWPEYLKDKEKAKVLTRVQAADAVSVIRGKGFKCKIVDVEVGETA